MKADNEFDRRLKLLNYPEPVHDAFAKTVDGLDLAVTAAQTLFGDQARPEHALEIYRLVLAAMTPDNPLPGTRDK